MLGSCILNIGPELVSRLFVVSQIINVHLPLQIGFSVSAEKNVVCSPSVLHITGAEIFNCRSEGNDFFEGTSNVEMNKIDK